MADTFSLRLSEYLDDDLTPGERLEVERHLLDCVECRTTLDALRDVMAEVQTLEDTPPVRDLWSGVRATLAAAPRRRFITMSIPQAMAAGVLLALVSGLVGALMLDRQRRESAGGSVVREASAPAAVPVSLAETNYNRAVDDLKRLLAEERARLNPKTVEALERNLATIDRAIAEAAAALAQDPSDAFLNSHLAQQRRAKLTLLRQANQMARSGL